MARGGCASGPFALWKVAESGERPSPPPPVNLLSGVLGSAFSIRRLKVPVPDAPRLAPIIRRRLTAVKTWRAAPNHGDRDMKFGKILTAGLIAGLATLVPASASATTTLLDLVDAPDQVNTPYSFDIVATSSSLTISFGGYQVPGVQVANYISLSTAGGANLLDRNWTFAPAPTGSWALQLDDSTSVNALIFYGTDVGSYDVFSQTISAVAGTTYRLAFLTYVNSTDLPPENGFRVTTDGTVAAVPEPASWALMIGGFAVAGGAMRRRQHGRIRFA